MKTGRTSMIPRLPIRSAIWAGVALCALAVPTLAQNHPRLGLYGHVRGNGIPFTLNDNLYGPLDNAALDAVARYQEVVLTASPVTEYRPDIIAALRARRPDIKLLAYVLGQYIWDAENSPDSLVHFTTRYRRLVRDLDGYLYNTSGQHYYLANVNLAKKDGSGRFVVAEALADLFIDAIVRPGLWDGIFFDQYCDAIGWSQGAETIDLARAGYPSQAAFDAGWKAGTDTLANRLRRGVSPAYLLVGNCGTTDKYQSFNGWMRENFPFQSGGTWYRNMLDNPRGYLAEEQLFRQPPHNYLFAASDNPATPYTAQSAQEVRFVLGSAALGAGFGVYAPANLDVISYPYHTWWYDEYAVDLVTARSSSSLSKTGWLGAALGPPHQMVWVGTNPDASTNPDFETDLSGWIFNILAPGPTFTRVTDTAAKGGASAKVTMPFPLAAEYSARMETTGRINVTTGQPVSATFWAKAEAPRTIAMVIGVNSSSYVASAHLQIGTTWQQYQVTFIPNASASVGLQFWLGLEGIDVWLDDVHLQNGTTSIYRRNFRNGIVLVNPGGTSLTLPLERQYQKLLGNVDPTTNNGAFVTQVTIRPSDALFLIGLDLVPPATVGDMRAVPYFVGEAPR